MGKRHVRRSFTSLSRKAQKFRVNALHSLHKYSLHVKLCWIWQKYMNFTKLLTRICSERKSSDNLHTELVQTKFKMGNLQTASDVLAADQSLGSMCHSGLIWVQQSISTTVSWSVSEILQCCQHWVILRVQIRHLETTLPVRWTLAHENTA